MISPRLANVILGVITLVWAANFLAPLVMPEYQPVAALNFVFMATAGVALAVRQDGNGSLLLRMIAAWRGMPLPPEPPAPPTNSTPPVEDRQP